MQQDVAEIKSAEAVAVGAQLRMDLQRWLDVATSR